MSEPLPSLALGQLTLYAKCSRRLARQLSDDRPSGPSADAPFRLTNAVTDAIRIAHRAHETDALPLDTTLAAIADAPAGLSVEEGLEYRSLIEQYREAFGDDDGVALDPRSGDNLRRESVAGRFVLSGRADVIVRGADGLVEVRKIQRRASGPVVAIAEDAAGGGPAGGPAGGAGGPTGGREDLTREWTDVGLAVILRVPIPPADNDPMMRVTRMWARPVGGMATRIVTRRDVLAFRDELTALVVAGRERAALDRVTPGWWCTSCRALIGCPAVAATPFEQLVRPFDEPVDSGLSVEPGPAVGLERSP